MNRWAVVSLALGLAACGPKIDPLGPMRAELARTKVDGPRGKPHMRFAIAESSLLDGVEAVLGLDETQVLKLPMAAAAKVDVGLSTRSIRFSDRPDCDCAHAKLQVRGTLDATVKSLLGDMRLADDLGFRGTLDGGVKTAIRPSDDGTTVYLKPVPRDAWRANVQLDEQRGILTDPFVNDQVANLLKANLSKRKKLFTIPASSPIVPRKLKLEGRPIPTVAGWLSAQPVDQAPPALAPTEGWALGVSDATLTATARAAASRLPQHKTWKVEPRSVTADADQFEGVIRVHKMGRKLKYRDYRVIGSVQLGRTLTVRPTTITEVGRKGSMGVYGPFMKGQVRKQVMRFDLETDPVIKLPLGKRAAVLTLENIERDGDGLRLTGSLSTEAHKP